jgi:hypothetical protein
MDRQLSSGGRCLLCKGTRRLSSTEYSWFASLQQQMQRVADAMQVGDVDRAYREARIAGSIANILAFVIDVVRIRREKSRTIWRNGYPSGQNPHPPLA